MLRKALFAVAAAFGLVLATPTSAADLTVDSNGILTGATGVNVGGTLYDVSFLDGTCVALFSGCTESTDFDFTTGASAEAAAQALLDQVFVGVYDANLNAISGCAYFYCYTFIPYEGHQPHYALAGYAFNSEVFVDYSQRGYWNNEDTSQYDYFNIARFSPSQAGVVPEPATWATMLLGFGAVGFSMRRRRSASTVAAIS